jgi:DNA polymerase-3 subunit delta
MRLKPEQLGSQLNKNLLPVYLVSGDEPLLLQEATDAIRAACRQQGFADREVYHADRNFDWQLLLEAGNSLSLFGDRKLIDLRLSGKPGDKGGKALVEFAANTNPDNVLLITTGRLDATTQKTRWVKALENAGALIQVWPVDAYNLPRWIEQRMRAAGIKASRDAAILLADQAEGNLLAAAQEIEKLRLRGTDTTVDADTIAAIVSDNARYDIFKLIDKALAGDAAASLRMLNSLKAEGQELRNLVGAIARELRSLEKMARQVNRGIPLAKAMDQARVWKTRKQCVGAALSRLDVNTLDGLIELTCAVDHANKGMLEADPWRVLRELVLQMAGKQWPLKQFLSG